MSGISKSQVSRLCAEIDERVGAFLERPIEGRWPYLWLDATYLKVRRAGRIVPVAATVAVAVNTETRTADHRGPRSRKPQPAKTDGKPTLLHYSRGHNPKIKHWMRNAQKRSIDDTCSHLGRLIDTIELSECQNYIQNAGYGSN